MKEEIYEYSSSSFKPRLNISSTNANSIDNHENFLHSLSQKYLFVKENLDKHISIWRLIEFLDSQGAEFNRVVLHHLIEFGRFKDMNSISLFLFNLEIHSLKHTILSLAL